MCQIPYFTNPSRVSSVNYDGHISGEMSDIEDIAQFDKLHKIAYDDAHNRQIIDDFLSENAHVTSWKVLANRMKAFQKIHKFPFRKVDLIASYQSQNLDNPELYKIIKKKAMRSQSGVLVVTVFTHAHPTYVDSKTGERKTQPFSCKHNCYYCPLEPPSESNGWMEQPRSYLSTEPGVARSVEVGYDTVAQVQLRIAQYVRMGHTIDKLEVLVLGGTFSEYPHEYQTTFVRDIYYASNTALCHARDERFPLETEVLLNERSRVRVIGLTLETRPDTITIDEIKRFRSFGCTRVQMGMQHTDDRILKLSNRGHTIEDTRNAIKLLKNNGYKLDLHVMPNLLGSNPEIDIDMMNQILYDPTLQADQLKLYPVSVVPWSVYEKMYNDGRYTPYSDEKLRTVLLYVMRRMHPWIRLNRVIRDIPMQDILGGCSTPNMREDLDRLSGCRDIRSREVKGNVVRKPCRKIRRYESSNGKEIFISYESEDEKTICGFLRLRIPSRRECAADVLPELRKCALIRELHVYGDVSAVGELGRSQHIGIGSRLLRDAERISIWNGCCSVVCIAGIGVREYYRKRGYTLTTEHGYVKKHLLLHAVVKILQKVLNWPLNMLNLVYKGMRQRLVGY